MVRIDLKCSGRRCTVSKGHDGPGCACYDGLLAADRARKERESRETAEDTMLRSPDLIPIPPTCLYVPHQGEEKLVGKLLEHRLHGLVFFHSHSRLQRHRATDCPSPLDEDALVALARWGVTYCYCYERDTQGKVGTMRRITVARAREAEAALYDGRLRRFPPEAAWVCAPGVTIKRGGHRNITLFDQTGLPILKEEWTERKVVLAPVAAAV